MILGPGGSEDQCHLPGRAWAQDSCQAGQGKVGVEQKSDPLILGTEPKLHGQGLQSEYGAGSTGGAGKKTSAH